MNAPTASTQPTTPRSTTASSIEPPRFGRLLGAELRRLWSRRFTKVLLGLCILGYIGIVVLLWSSFARPTAQDYARAEVELASQVSQQEAFFRTCTEQLSPEEQQTPEAFCGLPIAAEDLQVEWFLDVEPFSPGNLEDISLAVGVAIAMAGFVLAATFIGAEWSSRNIVAWLFYEPRRLRLIGAKILAVVAVMLVVSILAQLLWYFTGQLLISQRGVPVSTLPPERVPTFWSDLFLVQVRAMLLAAPVTLLGFGLANLIRNTAAATGIAFVYFVIVETIVRQAMPRWQPYLFQTAIEAWGSRGGTTVYGDLVYSAEYGQMPEEIQVTSLTGGLVLLAWAGAVLVVSLYLFRRRDIS